MAKPVEHTVPEQFTVMGCGPFHTLAGRLNLLNKTGTLRVWRLALMLWLPIAIVTGLRMLIGWGPDAFVLDISVHTRFLVAFPLLILSGHLVDTAARAAAVQLFNGDFADRGDLDRIFTRARRLRESGWIEAAFAVLALFGGQATLWGLFGPTGVFHGVQSADTTLMRAYYAGLALPILQFVTLRWVWRWLVWCYIVVAVARLPLRTIASHPDRAAGIGFISAPVTGFAVFEMSLATLLASVWGTQLLDGRVTVPSLLPTLLAFVLSVSFVACAPLAAYTPHLYTAKRRALLQHNQLALEYTRRFDRKWLDGRPASDDSLLGTSDIQSLADIGNAYKVIQDTRKFLSGKKKPGELWLSAVVPMVPLIVTVVPVEELFRRIGGTLVGGLLG